MTPAQIAGLQDTVEGDLDMLDGYDGLATTFQDKVKRAIQQGHVDDEDWKGVRLSIRD